MKRWQKVLLLLLAALVLSQIPFAYRRYKLGRLAAAIQHLNTTRNPNPEAGDFVEYKGAMHVHSFLGGHSNGDFAAIIEGALANQLNFVVMTEHPSAHFSTSDMTLKGLHAGILFLNGNEVSTTNGDRLLLVPGNDAAHESGRLSVAEILTREKPRGVLALVAYPEEFKSWDQNQYDGVEVYNVYTNARRMNPLVMFFDGVWSYRRYPDLLFATFYERPVASLRLWDEAIARENRKLVAVAGNDAHANIGISLRDSTGKTLLGVQLDPYDRSFRLVRVHVLVPRAEPLSSESLLQALAAGHAFIGFDLFCDSTGFSFTATSPVEQKIQGDEISLEAGEISLRVQTPVPGRIVLLKDGDIFREENGSQAEEFVVGERGAYRVEVYLSQLPSPVKDQPWIISNPIYVR